MAAVATSKLPTTATKMKKPSLPSVQTSSTSAKPSQPSASPSSAAKRLPGQVTPQSATTSISATTNGATRPNRRPHRISTRTGTSEAVPLDKKAAAKRCAEPYVPSEPFILRKFKGRAPSLIVHLHPTHFRFDQQDGSFSYQSEMRIFIEHLQKKTIPHDMLEELRKAEVQFYDGWLIVRIVDHKTVAQDLAGTGGSNDDEKPFSIHNHNNFITPSPYAPYPTKEQRLESAKLERQRSASKDVHSDLRSDDTIDVLPKSTKPQPKVYHVALRPTELSKHMDMMLDAMAPDPKALGRKQSQIGARTPGSGQPPTPIGMIPSTPGGDKPPPLKKQKLKIDPKDFLEYEARVVNSTAPPLFLDLVNNLDEAEQLMVKMRDPWHDAAPPSPKSRKRTVAELAADDAHAKEQERFMLIMDERHVGNNTGANAAGVDSQAGSTLFQPRFEKFNALDNIKREMTEKKQREKERQQQEEEARRGQQQQEEERRRIVQANERRRLQQQQQQQHLQQQQQAHAAALAAQRQAQAQRTQANSIPPQMQNQMTAAQASSPIIRQGTPHAASSPLVNNSAGGIAIIPPGSQTGGAGSPPRPGSALQHGHPGASMARGTSNQGVPSRNGTPQLGHNTPGMRTSTPVVRQSTPVQHMTQASPHSSMAAPTPQMPHAGTMGGVQMPNGIARPQMTQQQMQALQQRQLMQQQQQMLNGQAQLRAQQQLQMEQNAAMRQQQQAMQRGNPQGQQMSPTSSNAQAYNAQLAKTTAAQLQNVQQSNPHHGSPAANQMSQQQQMLQRQMLPQQQQMQQQQQQQMQQGQAVSLMGQQARPTVNQQLQKALEALQQPIYQNLLQQASSRYGGDQSRISEQEKQQIAQKAHQQARFHLRQRQQAAQNQQATMNMMARQQAQQQGGIGGHMPNGMGNGGQMNPGMAAMHQHQAAQMMQQQQMANAQNMMVQAQQQQQQQQQYQQQLNMMQQQHQGGQR